MARGRPKGSKNKPKAEEAKIVENTSNQPENEPEMAANEATEVL